MSARSETVKIRKIIKSRCPTVSVRMGKGTARNWIQIDGTKDQFGRFTPTEKRCLKGFGLETGLGGGAQIMPNEKPYFLKNKRVAEDRNPFKHW